MFGWKLASEALDPFNFKLQHWRQTPECSKSQTKFQVCLEWDKNFELPIGKESQIFITVCFISPFYNLAFSFREEHLFYT